MHVQVTAENLCYCQTLAIDHDLKLLQDACSKFECRRQVFASAHANPYFVTVS